MRAHGIVLAPTFVAFTPWTTRQGYLQLLHKLAELGLVGAVPPIQLTIRLLVPQGSYLLRQAEMQAHLGAYDPQILGYPWRHPDRAMDELQDAAQTLVAEGEAQGRSRAELFSDIWRMAHRACDLVPARLPECAFGQPIPHLSEQWYCCAEPTSEQLVSF